MRDCSTQFDLSSQTFSVIVCKPSDKKTLDEGELATKLSIVENIPSIDEVHSKVIGSSSISNDSDASNSISAPLEKVDSSNGESQ